MALTLRSICVVLSGCRYLPMTMSQTHLYGDLSGLFFVAASPVCDHCVVMDSTACLGNSRPCCDWLECNIVNKHSQSRGMKSLEKMTVHNSTSRGVWTLEGSRPEGRGNKACRPPALLWLSAGHSSGQWSTLEALPGLERRY